MNALRPLFAVFLLLALAQAAWADVELDADNDGKIDDELLPGTIARLLQVNAALALKQDALGYTPENTANKGAANGYASLGSDGKVPAAQLPESTGGASAIADLSDVDTTGKAEGKILVFDASGNLVVGDDQIGESGTGDITDVLPGTGLTGGASAGAATLSLADTAVTPGSYTYGNFTVDPQGRITAASSGASPVTTETDPLFSAWDKDYNDLINAPTIPVNLAEMVDDATHRWVTDSQVAAWTAKQDALVADTDYLSPTTAAATYVPLLTKLPTAAPTNGRQIIQAVGGCSDTSYDNLTDCENNSGTWTTPTGSWTSVIEGLINDAGTGADDLWSAEKVIAMLATKQNAMGADDNYVTDAEKTVLSNTSGTNTGDQDLSGYVQSSALNTLATATLACGAADMVPVWDGANWGCATQTAGSVDWASPGIIGATEPNAATFTTVIAQSFDTGSPDSGETGEFGLQEDPDNGTNVLTLKAPAAMETDVIYVLPAADGTAGQVLSTDGAGNLSWVTP